MILAFLMLVLFIFWIILVSYTIQCHTKSNVDTFQNKSASDKISVYILNYNRPHNIEKSIPYYSKMDIVSDIVVSHGHPDYYKEFTAPIPIKNIKDYENNKKYKAGRRGLIDLNNFDSEYILLLDDDQSPSEEYIKSMLEAVKEDPHNIYGKYERKCTPEGYDPVKGNVILIGLSVTSKDVIKNFQNKFHLVESILKEYDGNGEDLAFNHVIRSTYKKNPQHVPSGQNKISTLGLDGKGGYSSGGGISNYRKKRDEICQKLFKIPQLQL